MQRTFSGLRWLLTLLTPAAALLCLPSVPANAQVAASPSLLNFQGRLTTPNGTPVANGNYSIRFSLWSAAIGGTERWNQTLNPVAVKNGTFAVLLNVATPATLFDSDTYLEIKIGSDTPLSPRQRLASVAYALKANTVPDGSITGAKIANGTITANKLAGGGIAPSGAAGGDLTGTYPNPELRTAASSLYKVSGTLMSALVGGAGGVDAAQTAVNAQNQDEAWQSFTPSQSGSLTAFDVYIGTTTGQNKTIPLTVYAGEGTTGGVLGSASITVTPAMGFQNFSLVQPIPVVAGQKYTFYIGRSTSLQFGYSNADLYAGGRSDIGATLDYGFRTYMNSGANGRVAVNGNFTVTGNVGIGTTNPIDPLTIVGAGSAITALDNTVRTRLFSAEGTGNGYVGTASNHGLVLRTNDTDRLRIDPSGNIGIGTSAPEMQLHLTGNMLFNNQHIIYAKNATGANETFLFPRWSDNITYLNFGAGGFNIRNNANSPIMFMQNGGNVGIGTTSPGAKLSVNGAVNISGSSDLNFIGVGNDPGDIVFRTEAGAQVSRIYAGAGIINLSPREDSAARLQVLEGGINVNGSVTINDSNFSTLSLAFAGNNEGGSDTGIRHNADGRMALVSDGIERVIVGGGNVGLQGNTNNINGRLNINSGNQLFIYGLPDLGDFRNVQWNQSTGQLSQDSSSRRFKSDIKPLQDDFMKLLQVEAKTYTRPWNRNRWEIGFIAEDLDALGLNRLVWYEKDGKTPESLNYTKMVVYLTEIAKVQQKQLEVQKQKIVTLEKKSEEMDALKAQMETLMQRLEKLEAERK